MPEQSDEYLGEIFEDRDSRSGGRRIRILELHPDQVPRLERWPDLTAYRAIRVDELGTTIGRQRVRVTRRTLRVHYRKVSH